MPNSLRDLERRLDAAAKKHWTYRVEQLGGAEGLPFWRVRVPARGRTHTRVCLASGIHGDEPAGIEAMLRLLEGQEFAHGVAIDCFPCMNPEGAASGQREDAAGSDLNRLFGAFAPPETIRLFQEATRGVNYDLYVDLHEDNRSSGYYLFESDSVDERLGALVIQALARTRMPVEPAGALQALVDEDGFERYGPFRIDEGVALHAMASDVSQGGMPQAVYMRACRGAHILTLESPSQLPFEQRVAMHLTAMRTIFRQLRAKSHFAPLNPHREWLASEPYGKKGR